MFKKAVLYAKNMTKNPLFYGSTLTIFGNNLANFFAYVYHFVLGRLLGKDHYGELVAILSLTALLSTTYTFAGLVITKYVSAANEKEQNKLFSWFSHKTFKYGSIIALVVLLTTPLLSNLLHLKLSLSLLIAPIFFLGLVSFVYKSFLQGTMKFGKTIILSNVELLGRLLFGLILVLLGVSVFGAVTGIFLSLLVTTFLGRKYLVKYRLLKKDTNFHPGKKIVGYTTAIFLSTIASTSLFSTDVLLVKHFAHLDSGIYAAVSTLGKTILFASLPVSSVMFPIISQRHSQGKNYRKVFLASIGLSFLISLGVLAIFVFFPNVSIKILYGNSYLGASYYLVYYGIFLIFFTLSSVFVNYYLSIERLKVISLMLIAAVCQAIGIILFHDNLMSVIRVSIFVSFGLFVILLLYFLNDYKNEKE